MIPRLAISKESRSRSWIRLVGLGLPPHRSFALFLLICMGCQPDRQPSASTQWEVVQPDGVASTRDLVIEPPSTDPPVDEPPTTAPGNVSPQPSMTADKWGRKFFTDSERFQRPPTIQSLSLPVSDGDEAIWGATGRDAEGAIYLGLASKDSSDLSAGLLRFSPQTGETKVLGRVNDELGIADGKQKATLQDKIHSKFFEATDGHLYFASLDETGEETKGLANAKGGGYLIRLHRTTGEWERVLHTPESLISIGCSGRYIYALGYFGSRVYQFDTKTEKVRSVVVPNYGGHVSRNLLVTPTGHVLALRVTPTSPDDNQPGTNWTTPVPQDDAKAQFEIPEGESPRRRLFVELVEFDTDLNEVQTWPLDGYEAHGSTSSHGIISFASLMDGSILFTTQNGRLWRVHPTFEKTGKLESLGWIHPEGESSSTAMFAPTGKDFIIAVTKVGRRFDLLVYYLRLQESVTLALDPASEKLFNKSLNLLYGSETMDNFGNAYIAGWTRNSSGYVPLALQLQWR